MTRILFVCLGNICRSPAAEGIFRDLAKTSGSATVIDSAGTSNWHIGSPPYAPMIAAASARGCDLSPLRARQFTARDFTDFNLIIAMDDENLRDIERLRPTAVKTPVHLFLDYAPETGVTQVPDPYYTRDFETALDLIETASSGLLASLG